MIILYSTIVLFLIIELLHNLRPKSPLTIKPSQLHIDKLSSKTCITFLVTITNPSLRKEVMIPDFKINYKLLSEHPIDTNSINITTSLKTEHKDLKNRKDNYWQACILKSNSSRSLNVKITLSNENNFSYLELLDTIWVEFNWINYGSFGIIKRYNAYTIPLNTFTNEFLSDQISPNGVIPVKTHILGIFDDPINTIADYVNPYLKEGDIVTIGESPLAIMQGNYIHPSNIKTTFTSRILSSFFHPTSSLATACGMQVLLDKSGPTRVLFAWFIGGFLKLFQIKGIFYRLAGSQARLIDDITGTTPPYDQTIVLGPSDPSQFCNEASIKLGCHFAIVDVNDLGRVKILASDQYCNQNKILKALVTNPAGNDDQRTPIVIIRN